MFVSISGKVHDSKLRLQSFAQRLLLMFGDGGGSGGFSLSKAAGPWKEKCSNTHKRLISKLFMVSGFPGGWVGGGRGGDQHNLKK